MAAKAKKGGAAPTTSADKPTRWRRRAAERPGEIVAAAKALFAERGFERTRMEDVAARAGVTKATVYLYFADKERLFEAVVREALTANIDRLEAIALAYDGSTESLLRMMATMLEGILETSFPAIVKMIVAEADAFPGLAKLYVDLVMNRGFRLMERIVRRGVERGELRDVDPAAVTPLVVAPFLVLAIWKQSFGRHSSLMPPAHDVIRAHVDVLVRGLAASGPVDEPAPRARPPRARRVDGRTRAR
jgi:AcrR family transcriptional regulator